MKDPQLQVLVDQLNEIMSKSEYYSNRKKLKVTDIKSPTIWGRRTRETSGTYEVYALDYDGHYKETSYGYYAAKNSTHARLKAAVDYNRADIFFTGDFSTEKVKDVDEKVRLMKKKIQRLEEELYALQNPK